MLKKYYSIFRYIFVRSLQFRAEIIIYVFLDVIPFFVLIFLWNAVYANTTSIHSYTLPDIINYYILVILMQRLTASYFEGWRSEEIRMGKIDYYLTRPFSYIQEVVTKSMGDKLTTLAMSLPILTILYLVFINFFHLSVITIAPANIASFLIITIVAFFLQLVIALWIVLLTFWFEGSSGLEHFKWIVIALFSGQMIPFEFMPTWLKTGFNILPFKYINYVPIQVIQGKMTLQLNDYLSIFTVVIICVLITHLLWKKAIYKYSSAGG